MRETDLWPSCPWQVLEACRDASVSPQLRTARPARAPASRQPGQHGSTASARAPARAGHCRALQLLLIILREHTRFTPPWRPKGVAFGICLCYVCSAADSSSSVIHCPSSIRRLVDPGAARPSGSAVLCLQGNAPGLGWLGWQRREIDTILRLFLALLPPRYRRLVSPPLAARRLTATITHATCHMPHLPALPHMPHAVPLPLLLCPHTHRSPAPHPAQCHCQCQCPSQCPSRPHLSLASDSCRPLACAPRTPPARLVSAPPAPTPIPAPFSAVAFRVFAALQLRTSLTRPPTRYPLPITHYPLHITHYCLCSK
jgi:hypothetical protein